MSGMFSTNIARVFLLIALACTVPAFGARADACGDRVSALEAGTKNLALKQRTRVTSEFDAFYLESSSPSARITISCGPKILSLDVGWSGGSLSSYGELIEHVGNALDFGSPDFPSSLQKCWDRANVDGDEDEDDATAVVPTSRAQISCVDKDGNALITVARPPS